MKKYLPYLLMFIIVLVLYGDFIFSDKVLFGTDFLDMGYYGVKLYRTHILKYHTFPLWDPYIHGGMPFIEAMHGAIFSPLVAPIRILLPPHRSFGITIVLHIFLAGLFMFLLLRHYKLRIEAAIFGAIAYMLMPVMVSLSYAGQDGKIFVMSMTPLMVLLLERALKSLKITHFALFSVGYALLIFTAHMQLAYFLSWLLAAIFLFRVIRMIKSKDDGFKKASKAVVLFLIFLILGVGISAIQLIPPYHYLKHYSVRTIHVEKRGIEYSNTWRLNAEDMGSIVFPDFVGMNVGKYNSYWGRNFFRLNSLYFGLIIVILGLLGFFYLKEPLLRLLGVFSAFILTYTMGTQTPLFYIYYYVIPGVKNFRAPETALFVAAFCFFVSAAFTVDKIFSLEAKKSTRKKHSSKEPAETKLWRNRLLWGGLAATLLFVILAVFGKPLCESWIKSVYNSQTTNIQYKVSALASNFKTFLKSSVLSLVFCWIGLGALIIKLRSSSKSKFFPLFIAMLLIIPTAIDFWRIDRRFIVADDIGKYFPENRTVKFFEQRREKEGPFRVFALPKTMKYTQLGAYGIDVTTLGELHGNQLRWYDEFTGRHEQPQWLLVYRHFWDILNFEYLLSPQPLDTEYMDLSFVGQTDAGLIYRNTIAFPRVRTFHKWEVMKHEDVLKRIRHESFYSDTFVNYRNTVLLEEDPGFPQPTISPDSALWFIGVTGTITDYKENEFTVKTNLPYDGILFISQNWYPAWHAEENGKKLKIIRANYSFIGVPLRAGPHVIHFYYHSPLVKKSLLVSIASSIIVLICLVVPAIFRKRSRSIKRAYQRAIDGKA